MKVINWIGITLILLLLVPNAFSQNFDSPEVLDRLAEGRSYETGNGVPVNLAMAQSIYQQETDNGSPLGKVLLAQFYLFSEDPNWLNVDLAHQLLDELVTADVVQGIYLKGYSYMFGVGEPINYDQAEELLVRSVNVQHTPSLYSLGFMYYENFANKQDYEKAFKLFELGSFQDHANCHYMLGLCYENGHGTSQDITKAQLHYEKAIQGGNIFASDALAALLNQNPGGRKAEPNSIVQNLSVVADINSPYIQIEFSLRDSDHIKIEIYDFSGRLVSIHKDEILNSGNHEFKFATQFENGIYILRFSSSKATKSIKILK